MNWQELLTDLEAERNKIDRLITELNSKRPLVEQRPEVSGDVPRKFTRKWSLTQRENASRRMRAYWAARRGVQK